jgi:hypothetical protein
MLFVLILRFVAYVWISTHMLAVQVAEALYELGALTRPSKAKATTNASRAECQFQSFLDKLDLEGGQGLYGRQKTRKKGSKPQHGPCPDCKKCFQTAGRSINQTNPMVNPTEHTVGYQVAL